MAQHGSLLHLPKNLKYLQHSCPICIKIKMPRLSRNPKLSLSKLAPGQMLQMDFAFMNTQSVCGSTSYLLCVCVSTKYCFKFCTCYKRVPVDIIKWVLNTFKSQKKTTNYVRFDEGGELARSYEVNKILIEECGIIMQSTGDYASNLNGIVERGHRTDGDVIRASLYAADLPDSFWCYSLMYANHINRRWCVYPETTTPYELWTKQKPSFNKFHIFGATVYAHNHMNKCLIIRLLLDCF